MDTGPWPSSTFKIPRHPGALQHLELPHAHRLPTQLKPSSGRYWPPPGHTEAASLCSTSGGVPPAP